MKVLTLFSLLYFVSSSVLCSAFVTGLSGLDQTNVSANTPFNNWVAKSEPDKHGPIRTRGAEIDEGDAIVPTSPADVVVLINKKFEVYDKKMEEILRNMTNEEDHLLQHSTKASEDVNGLKENFDFKFKQLEAAQDKDVRNVTQNIRKQIVELESHIRKNIESLKSLGYRIDQYRKHIGNTSDIANRFKDEILVLARNAKGINDNIFDAVKEFRKFASTAKTETHDCFREVGLSHTILVAKIKAFLQRGIEHLEPVYEFLKERKEKQYLSDWKKESRKLIGFFRLSADLDQQLKNLRTTENSETECIEAVQEYITGKRAELLPKFKEGFI